MRTVKLTICCLISAVGLISNCLANDVASPPNNLASSQPYAVTLESAVVSFTVKLSPQTANVGDTITLVVDAEVAKGWHINPIAVKGEDPIGYPSKIKLSSEGLDPLSDSFELMPPLDENAKDQYLAGSFSWRRNYRVTTDMKLLSAKGSITYQACNDQKCLRPMTVNFSLDPTHGAAETKQLSAVENPSKPIGDSIKVDLQDCKLTRPQVKLSLGGTMLSIFFGGGPQRDKLVLQGRLPIEDGPELNVYLPDDSEYQLANTAASETRLFNTSTFISIDQDGDGVITESESYPCSRPLRIHDSMFAVTDIDKELKSIAFQRIDAPVSGSVLGRKCPPFELTTVDGEKITNESIQGKVTILDVWAVT